TNVRGPLDGPGSLVQIVLVMFLFAASRRRRDQALAHGEIWRNSGIFHGRDTVLGPETVDKTVDDMSKKCRVAVEPVSMFGRSGVDPLSIVRSSPGRYPSANDVAPAFF